MQVIISLRPIQGYFFPFFQIHTGFGKRNILQYSHFHSSHSIIHLWDSPHIHRKITADRNILKQTGNRIHGFAAAEALTVPECMLQTDLRFKRSHINTFFITQFDICHRVSIDGNDLQLLCFIVYNKKKQCIGLPALGIIAALLYRTIDINPHHEVGFDICIIQILFSLISNYTLLPLFLTGILCGICLPRNLLLIRIFCIIRNVEAGIFRLRFDPCHNHKCKNHHHHSGHKIQCIMKFCRWFTHSSHDVLRNFHNSCHNSRHSSHPHSRSSSSVLCSVPHQVPSLRKLPSAF